MKDQFNNTIPSDLVVLETPISELTIEQRRIICDELDWYEYEGGKPTSRILLSADAIEKTGELDVLLEDPAWVEVGTPDVEQVLYIACALRRYSDEDGFYHA